MLTTNQQSAELSKPCNRWFHDSAFIAPQPAPIFASPCFVVIPPGLTHRVFPAECATRPASTASVVASRSSGTRPAGNNVLPRFTESRGCLQSKPGSTPMAFLVCPRAAWAEGREALRTLRAYGASVAAASSWQHFDQQASLTGKCLIEAESICETRLSSLFNENGRHQ
jgi:hypothetical protein